MVVGGGGADKQGGDGEGDLLQGMGGHSSRTPGVGVGRGTMQ